MEPEEASPPPILHWLIGAIAAIALGLLLTWKLLALTVFFAGSVLSYYIGHKIGHRDGTKWTLVVMKDGLTKPDAL